ASVILFIMGLGAALATTILTGVPAAKAWRGVPTPYFFAGLCMAFYVLSVTYLGPRLGLGNAIFLVLLGQIVAVAVIDHYGLLGAHRTPLGLARIIGIMLMALGLYLARRPPGA
ncbi:MAG: DMT family transporter, partial [Alphaproteobacteria bacterium]|nr:DMT family transporter [Alphaproteobacteria bacterium]